MRPVLLLNVRIVVFLVRPTSCELNPPPATVTLQMVVDEFRAVVRINAPQGKWQALPHLLHRRHDPGLALSQHRPRLHPTRVDIGHVQRVNELAITAITRVRHQVHLDKARFLHVPRVGLDGNMMLQQSAWLGPAVVPLD